MNRGAVKAESSDLKALRRELNVTESDRITAPIDAKWQRESIVEWDFDELPKSITIDSAGIQIPVYPTVIDSGESVCLSLLESATLAKRQSIAASVACIH